VAIVKLPSSDGQRKSADDRFNIVDNPELIGLCRGVIADGMINLAEAQYIQEWLAQRPNLLETWPASDLNRLLGKILEDGVLSDREQKELSEMLEEVIGDPSFLHMY
jgi:hypothetical protein